MKYLSTILIASFIGTSLLSQNWGTHTDIELPPLGIVASEGSIYLDVDKDMGNNSEDPNVFGVLHGGLSNLVFFVDQDGRVVADGNLSAKRITAGNTNDSDPDLQLTGSNAIIKANSFNSNMRLESNGDITVQVGQLNGSSATSRFAVLDNSFDQAFSVDEIGTTRVYNVLVTSDRNKKENISAVSNRKMLESLLEMPIYKWNYKKKNREHIGPMAQDFLSAFKLGNDDTTISNIDSDGISLAAIKGLYELMQEEIEKKTSEILKLEERLTRLEVGK